MATEFKNKIFDVEFETIQDGYKFSGHLKFNNDSKLISVSGTFYLEDNTYLANCNSYEDYDNGIRLNYSAITIEHQSAIFAIAEVAIADILNEFNVVNPKEEIIDTSEPEAPVEE